MRRKNRTLSKQKSYSGRARDTLSWSGSLLSRTSFSISHEFSVVNVYHVSSRSGDSGGNGYKSSFSGY